MAFPIYRMFATGVRARAENFDARVSLLPSQVA
jgi:hypothetical protein